MLTESLLNGHKVLWLQNNHLRLAVLPQKGADIAQLIHLPSGVQFLMQTPAGLRPPATEAQRDFLANYEGGWQELFPNANDACEVNGRRLPFHGEVALLPWQYESLGGDELHLWVDCQETPFRVERRMKLREAVLEVESRLSNTAETRWPFVWGQHIVLGGEFLQGGCRLETPARFIATPPELFEPATARLAENQWEHWPFARGRMCGEQFDLRQIPGPEARSHDDAFLTGLEAGRLEVRNPSLGLKFRLEWDADLFPWVALWQPFGGADLPPLTGIYGLGIEPWISRYNLADAITARQARYLEGGASLTTRFNARIEQIS